MRTDGRTLDQSRDVEIQADIIRNSEGSVLIKYGHTHVICTASVELKVPKWMQGSGKGWLSAEYGMLPRSTHSRMRRDKAANSGRTQEISRLIGRSLRAVLDMEALGEKQIYIDCDVIQADGGTRTAAITGGFVALAFCLNFLKNKGELKTIPLKSYLSAVSVGLKANEAFLDLNYDEDSTIETDMNFVLTSHNKFVEIQGTAEAEPFDNEQLQSMIKLAQLGCEKLFKKQQDLIGDFFPLN
ncbi:MAG: ribonuclease PH [Bdellovibrionaceae bacterium]|jgi:ribonuclease PH|nr:ribonuclease PH [Pseudobdellovibrionaceae bacterium]